MRIPFDQLDREQMGRPMRLSIVFHICVFTALGLMIVISGFFHGSEWGTNAPQGAIQATLVSAAPMLPLPQIQQPNKDVLATETPSEAAAIPQQKTEAAPLPNAVEIKEKRRLRRKEAHQAVPQRAKPQKQEHRVRYGERQEASIPRATEATQAPAQVITPPNTGGSFASLYSHYVSLMTSTISQNWLEQVVDPSTPHGAKTVVEFRISRSGAISNIRIAESSGSPSLDQSAIIALHRVGSFLSLPEAYQGSYIDVRFTFTYSGS